MRAVSETRPRCYVASPLGFNEAGRAYYASTYIPALERVVETVDPWLLTSEEDVARARAGDGMRALWLAVGARNLELIAGCELLVAWLDGQEVDSGTATEVGYAAGVGVRCYGLRTDLRQAGEEGVAVNLQVEAAIVGSGGSVAPNLDALLAAIAVQARC
jgi:nucleoside 2-deoxyribosyltransferase